VQWPWLWMLHGLSLTIDYATREETFSSWLLEHAIIKDICKHFGLCSSKNGWRYDQMLNEEDVKLVKEFYWKVIFQVQLPNLDFSLQVSRDMVCKAKGIKLN
jgi:hypothetical protein